MGLVTQSANHPSARPDLDYYYYFYIIIISPAPTPLTIVGNIQQRASVADPIKVGSVCNIRNSRYTKHIIIAY